VVNGIIPPILPQKTAGIRQLIQSQLSSFHRSVGPRPPSENKLLPKIPQDEPKHLRQIGISADVPPPLCRLYHSPTDDANEPPSLHAPLTLPEYVVEVASC